MGRVINNFVSLLNFILMSFKFNFYFILLYLQCCISFRFTMKWLSYTHMCVFSRFAVSHSLWPHGLEPAKFLCLWDFPGKNIGVGCRFLLQVIFPIREWTHLSCISCIGRYIFTTVSPGKPPLYTDPSFFQSYSPIDCYRLLSRVPRVTQ